MLDGPAGRAAAVVPPVAGNLPHSRRDQSVTLQRYSTECILYTQHTHTGTKTISFIRYEKIHEKKKSQKNIRTIDYLLLRVPSELTNILRVRSVIFPLDIV